MTVCANTKTFGIHVNGFITQYESMLKTDGLSEIDSADTHEVLKQLYAYRNAVKANDLNYINTQGITVGQKEWRQDVLERTFKDVFGDTFSYTKGNTGKTSQGTLVSAIPSGDSITLNFTENGKDRSHSFSLTSNERSHSNTNTGKYINLPGVRNLLDNYALNLKAKEEMELVLGSKESNLKLEKKYQQKDYVHGSISHMKTTLKKLHLLGGEKASQEELDLYLTYVNQMTPEFFDSMELYIQEDANVSQGQVRSGGLSAAGRIDITVKGAPSTMSNQQSEASIYIEEILHSMTAAAMNSTLPKAIKLQNQLHTFIETARKQLTWKDLLPKDSIDSAAEEKHAKWLYSYIFSGKNADYEFIAKAVAVPEVANALKYLKVREPSGSKTIAARVSEFFSLVVDVLKGNFTYKQKNKNLHEAVVNLAYDLAKVNSKANRKLLDKGNLATSMFDFVHEIDVQTGHKVNKIASKLIDPQSKKALGPIPENLYGKVSYYTKLVSLSLVNPVYAKTMGVIGSAWGLKPEGTVREVLGGMFASDSAQKIAEFLTMQSGHIDKQRNTQADVVRLSILSGFDNPKDITTTQEEALTALISDLDLGALFGNDSVAKDMDMRQTTYNNKTLRKMLLSDAELDKTINDVKAVLKKQDSTHYTWHRDQSVGLGIYMATHQGNPEQNLNAHNIARGLRSSHSKRPEANVEKTINELASLVGIKNTNMEERKIVAGLMETQWTGVQHVADIVEGFKKNSDETVFKGSKTNKIKGYSREVFDDTIIMEIAPVEDQKKMEAQGFTKKNNLIARAGDVRNKPMALYITDSASRPERLRGGVRLNQMRSKGTTITDASYKDGEGFSNTLIRERAKRDIANIERASLARAKKMELGSYEFKDTVYGVVPVINESGKVIDYRYMMDKATKKELLKQDTRISEVMARSFGTILDKAASSDHNKRVLEVVKTEMEDNWTQGNVGNDGMTPYTLIGPKVADPEMRKLYYMLPREFHTYVKSREDNTMAVRADLHHMFFGYTHVSIANFPGLQKITPKVLLKLIKFAEMMWMEMVKVVKANILIKTPVVLFSNILSNMLYATLKGYNPATVLVMYTQSYRKITKYNKDIKRVQELTNLQREIQVALTKDTLSDQRKNKLSLELRRTSGELEATQRRAESSSIHELVEMGLDQGVEDTTNETDTNRISSFFDGQLQKVPEAVRVGTDVLFLTKRTMFYKVANEFLGTSDMIARDVQNTIEKKTEVEQANGKKTLPLWWVKDQSADYSIKQRLTGEERSLFLKEAKTQREYDLVEDYINYTKPSSRLEEYLNRVGILMFTKYVKRIQRIIMKAGSNAPLKSIFGLMTFSYLGGLPSIHEQSFMAKDWYSDSIGPGNIVPVYAPIETLMNFYTPSLVEASTYGF